MNGFKIAWMLFKNNLKLYKFYLAVLILTAAIYYNFLAVNYNPYLGVLKEQYIYAQTASALCSIVLFFMALSFMTHANNFFYKLRYKEVGTYMLMGIPGSKIGRVFAIESIFLGSAGVIIGVPVGILFSKLFFMLLGKAMILDVQIPFYIPVKAISMLLFIFTGIITMMGIKNYWMVKRSKLIEILNAARKEQSIPPARWIRGALGIVCISAGYILCFNILWVKINYLNAWILTLMLIIIGTYFFFGSFLSIALGAFIKNKRLIYRGSRLVSFSNTLFRLGTHYRSLSMTTILCASTLTAFSGSLALKYYADTKTSLEAPYSISYINQDEGTEAKIREIIENSPHKILSENRLRFIVDNVTYNDGYGDQSVTCLVTGYSEVKKSLAVTNPKNYISILKDIEVKDDETVSILHSSLVFSGISNVGKTIVIDGKPYVLTKEVRIPFIGDMPDIGQYQTYIVTDKQYDELKKSKPEMVLTGINFTEPEKSIDLVKKIGRVMKNPGGNMNSIAGQYQYKYYLIGAFYFLGLVMAIVFMVSTFSTIYFKILSDAILDRQQYGILMKIGMSREEISKSICTQVALAFVLPAAMGIMHSIMMIKTLETFMHYRFTGSIVLGGVIFAVIMTVFYVFISKKYKDMVMEGSEGYEAALS